MLWDRPEYSPARAIRLRPSRRHRCKDIVRCRFHSAAPAGLQQQRQQWWRMYTLLRISFPFPIFDFNDFNVPFQARATEGAPPASAPATKQVSEFTDKGNSGLRTHFWNGKNQIRR